MSPDGTEGQSTNPVFEADVDGGYVAVRLCLDKLSDWDLFVQADEENKADWFPSVLLCNICLELEASADGLCVACIIR